jgi:diguanylate cyclase (GGDEF)-like protein
MLVDAAGVLGFRVAKDMARRSLSGSDFKISRSVVEEVTKTGKAVCSTNVLEDDNIRNRKSVLELGLESIMCVPLSVKGRSIGLLYVDSHHISSLFTETSLQVFQALADHAAIAIENARLYEMAITDEKTGLFNHGYFRRRLKEELERAERYAESVSLLMIDIDYFKSINDRFGHPAGDAVLSELGRLLRHSIRSHDLPARFGGEEFAIVMPEGPAPPELGSGSGRATVAMAERIRAAIAGHAFVLPQSGRVPVTVSIGCAHYPAPGIDSDTTLLDCADRLLYDAKHAGRNCVKSN